LVHQPVGNKYNKNNDSSSNCKQGLENLSISIPTKSFPSSFNSTKHGIENTQKLIANISKSNITALHFELECKCTAYKQITECEKYPFQQPAINHWK
jgi:hypothetical protein